MKFIKTSMVFIISLLRLTSDVIKASPGNLTYESQYQHDDMLRGEGKQFENNLPNDKETGNDVPEKMFDVHTYNLTTCKAVLKDNVKGRFNLSAHHLMCKYVQVRNQKKNLKTITNIEQW